jgi:hypothetical protein
MWSGGRLRRGRWLGHGNSFKSCVPTLSSFPFSASKLTRRFVHEQKGEAIARSSFSELLYLDSDNLVLSDPTVRFSSFAQPVLSFLNVLLTSLSSFLNVLLTSLSLAVPLRRSSVQAARCRTLAGLQQGFRCVSFPFPSILLSLLHPPRFLSSQADPPSDFIAANPIWRLLNTPCDPNHWQAETGQLLINKRARGGMNLVALEVARAMQADSGFWFHLSGGDKDTFVSCSSSHAFEAFELTLFFPALRLLLPLDALLPRPSLPLRSRRYPAKQQGLQRPYVLRPYDASIRPFSRRMGTPPSPTRRRFHPPSSCASTFRPR